DAGLATDLYAEHGLLTSADERISGRSGIAGWHEALLRRGGAGGPPARRGRVVAPPAGQGNDRSRLEVDGATGRYVVELAFDASGRIGTARWLTPAEADLPQEERERTATGPPTSTATPSVTRATARSPWATCAWPSRPGWPAPAPASGARTRRAERCLC